MRSALAVERFNFHALEVKGPPPFIQRVRQPCRRGDPARSGSGCSGQTVRGMISKVAHARDLADYVMPPADKPLKAVLRDLLRGLSSRT